MDRHTPRFAQRRDRRCGRRAFGRERQELLGTVIYYVDLSSRVDRHPERRSQSGADRRSCRLPTRRERHERVAVVFVT